MARQATGEHQASRRPGRRATSASTYAGAKGCRAVAAAAAASGPGFLARANAAALVGKAALAAPTLPRWMATPLKAAAVTTHTHANACLPSRSAFIAVVSSHSARSPRVLREFSARVIFAGHDRFAASCSLRFSSVEETRQAGDDQTRRGEI